MFEESFHAEYLMYNALKLPCINLQWFILNSEIMGVAIEFSILTFCVKPVCKLQTYDWTLFIEFQCFVE